MSGLVTRDRAGPAVPRGDFLGRGTGKEKPGVRREGGAKTDSRDRILLSPLRCEDGGPESIKEKFRDETGFCKEEKALRREKKEKNEKGLCYTQRRRKKSM